MAASVSSRVPARTRRDRLTPVRPAESVAGTVRAGAASALLGLWMLGATAGCASPPAPSAPAPSVRLRIGVTQPAGAPTGGAAARQVAELLRYAALVVTSRDGTIQPGLADRWAFSPDRRELRLTLKPQLTFQDGTPLDARAAAAQLDEARRDPLAAPGLRDVVGVRPLSATELVVEQGRPSALLLEALAMTWVVGGRNRESTAGPFRLASSDGEPVVLEAFDGYYRGRPSIDRIEIQSFPSARAGWVALMRDEIDFLYDLPPDALEFVEASTDIQVFSHLRSYTFLFGFNLAHPTLRDPRVRRAMGLALDRQAIVDHVFGGRAREASGGVWFRHWAHDTTRPPPAHAPNEARQLLDAAIAPRGAGGARGASPRLRLSCLVPAGYATFERLALVLQRQLLDVGVDLQLEVVEARELQQRLGTGRFDTYLFEQTAFQLNWTYSFWHSPEGGPVWIRSGYQAADAALDRMRYAKSDDEFRAAVQEVQHVLTDDPPAIFLVWSERSRAVRRRFAVPAEEGRDIVATLSHWRLASGGGAP